jgi:hypothetical protein
MNITTALTEKAEYNEKSTIFYLHMNSEIPRSAHFAWYLTATHTVTILCEGIKYEMVWQTSYILKEEIRFSFSSLSFLSFHSILGKIFSAPQLCLWTQSGHPK